MEATLYKQFIIDHYKHPHNYGEISDSCLTSHIANLSCGDDINLYIAVEDGVIKDAKFTGSGCAISIASASMLTEKLKGMKIPEAKGISADDILVMLGMKKSSGRIKCALLPYEAFNQICDKFPSI